MITVHTDFEQGSYQWIKARLGIVTASEVDKILTPAKLEYSKQATAYVHQLAAERISGMPSPQVNSMAMERGHMDEISAREMYGELFGSVATVGFITNDLGGATIGFSPDGLVGDDGFIECKSRDQKYQIDTVINGEMPRYYWLQVQSGFLASGRKWCDFLSYSEGMHLFVKRILPCQDTMAKIREGVIKLETDINLAAAAYRAAVQKNDYQYIKPVTLLED